MRLLSIGIMAIGVALAGCVATTAPGIRTGVAGTKVVLDGKPLQINAWYSLNADCSSRGLARVRIVSPPQGGSIDIREAPDYPSYSGLNSRAHCNKQRILMTQAFYVPRPDFKGLDSFRLETVFPTGNAQVVTYRVEVR